MIEKLYYSLIRQGRKTLEDVPEKIKAQVKALLNEKKQEGE